jgi:hypothetical protein
MRNISDKSCRENQNTHFMFKFFFLNKIMPFHGIMWKKNGRVTETIDEDIMPRGKGAVCMPDNSGKNADARIIFGTYYFIID